MFRWLKDRKKQRKGGKSGETPDDYGFNGKDGEDKSYHIYEEIPDLPHLARSRSHDNDDHSSSGFRESSFSDNDFSFDHSQVFSAETLKKYIIGTDRDQPPTTKRDGPYMVVPLLNSGEEEKPPLPPPNEKKAEFTCALVGRRHSSLSRSTESGVEVSYDSSESQGSELHFPEQIVEVEVHSPDTSPSTSHTSGSRMRRHIREGSLDTSDTGCEYDMGTSSESDHTNYEFYLNKIEQNLLHKCKIREIIQQCVPEEEESDSESLTTVSSMCSSVRRVHRSTDIDSDEGTLADHSESENSSGYYESFTEKERKVLNSAYKPVGLKSDHRDLKSCLKGTNDSRTCKNRKRTVPKKKHRSVDALALSVPSTQLHNSGERHIDTMGLSSNNSAFKKVVHKPVRKDNSLSRLYGDSIHDIDTSNIQLDLYEPEEGSVYGSSARPSVSLDSAGREVYSPPPSVHNFTARTVNAKSAPRSNGCTNVYRSKGSQNRLLSDLIIMNYDRQLFMH